MHDELLRHQIEEFANGRDVAADTAETLFDALIGSSDQMLLALTLAAWNEKGVAEDELFDFASLMRKRMKRIETGHGATVDIVGTGGSEAKSFNVSTAAAFVVAGAGVKVAKHGNRAATSRSGSSDVLSVLGIDVDVEPSIAEAHLNEHNICFMFAPRFHSLSPTLAAARRSVGRPTIFNNLGPLCNPASAPHHVIGVWDYRLVEKTANVLTRLGSGRSWVVNGQGGLDEIALDGTTNMAEINDGSVLRFDISASDFGVGPSGEGFPSNCTASESAATIRAVLSNELKQVDTEKLVLINAAAAIYVAGKTSHLPDAYNIASESVRSGSALAKLKQLSGGQQ